jgi:hypothetical protein
MRDKLPKDVAKKLVAAIRLGKKLDAEIAPAVAEAIKGGRSRRASRTSRTGSSRRPGSRPRSTTPS